MINSRWFRLGLLLAFALRASTFSASAHNTPAEEMAAAAQNFLAALTPEQTTKATFSLNDTERQNWNFVPLVRKGLTFKEMTPAQRLLGQALLSSALSQRGYLKATTIMSLDDILRDLEQGKGPVRDPELYYVSIFGKPGGNDTWGWRVEGHHLSLNFAIIEGADISVTPSFFGSNPAEVLHGPRSGLRVLGVEDDLGHALIHSFTEEQRQMVIYTNIAPKEVITGNSRKIEVLKPVGLPASKMNSAQQKILQQIIEEYVRRYRQELADADLAKLAKAGKKNLYFAWAGGIEPGQGHYYRVQNQSFLLEFDNTQNNANHIHAVWRDLDHDFGGDLLREHYDKVPHP